MSTEELIMEADDATPPQLAIVTRIIPGRVSKGARGDGDKSRERLNSKVAHVSLTRMRSLRVGRGNPPQFRPGRVEVEVLAHFEGSTSEDAAHEFIALYRAGRTPASGARCVADGPPPPEPPLWTDHNATFHLIA